MQLAQDDPRDPAKPAGLQSILDRRSVGRLVSPGPTDTQLASILAAGASAPDHGELRTFRFIVLQGKGKDEFSKVLLQGLERRSLARGTSPTSGQIKKESSKLDRAPVIIVVASEINHSSRIPEIEQILSAGAAAQNILLASSLLGFDSMWRTGEVAYDPFIKTALGLQETSHIVGWLYIGTRPTDISKEARIDISTSVTTFWSSKS